MQVQFSAMQDLKLYLTEKNVLIYARVFSSVLLNYYKNNYLNIAYIKYKIYR